MAPFLLVLTEKMAGASVINDLLKEEKLIEFCPRLLRKKRRRAARDNCSIPAILSARQAKMTPFSQIFSVKTKMVQSQKSDFIDCNLNLAQQDPHVVCTWWKFSLVRQKLSNTTDYFRKSLREKILSKILPHTCGSSWANCLARQRAQTFTSSVRRP